MDPSFISCNHQTILWGEKYFGTDFLSPNDHNTYISFDKSSHRIQANGNLDFNTNGSAIQKIEDRFIKLQQLTRIGIWELNLRTNELVWSNEIYRIFELEPSTDKTSYQAFLNSVHPDDRESVKSAYETSLKNKTPYAIDHRIQLKDGRTKFVHEKCETSYDSEGNPICSIGTVQDISGWKLSEEENRKLQDELAQTLKMRSIGQFSGGVAHHFNNMLSIILGHVDLALDEIDTGGQSLQNNLMEIKSAAQRSASLTYQLLSFACQQAIVPKHLDINTFIEKKLKKLRQSMGKTIELVWEPDIQIGSVRIDPNQFGEVLMNMSQNALDAISKRGKITFKTKNTSFNKAYCKQHPGYLPGSFVMLSISDNGQGMEKHTLNHIFEPFFTTKEVGKGTGLGLAIVYGIVEQNKGFIVASSKPDQGTIFKIYLPIQK